MRIKNKRKFVRGLIIIAIILLAITSKSVSKSKKEYEEYIVQEGDTLWNIALEYKDEKQDTREYIYELKKLNNMNTSELKTNEKIMIIK